jgi:hypothetical protein
MQVILSRTDKTKNDKVFRLKAKIEGRLQYFINQIYNTKWCHYPKIITKLSQIEQEYTSYISLLDINILHTNTQAYETIYKKVSKWKDRKSHLFDEFGIIQEGSCFMSTTHKWLFEMMKDSSERASYQRTQDRIKLELADKQNDWFIVFSTLTVDSENYIDVFTKGSNCWRNYIRTIDRAVAKDCYGSYRKAKGKEYFHYFGVVEEGGTTGRLHIHTLMFMKSLIGCRDPNYGRAIPDYREIKDLTKYWQYGFSSHIAIRFSQNDAFGKAGWRWNVDKKTGQPIKNSEIGRVAGYLVKYILKSKSLNKGEIRQWKIKTDRKLGLIKIRKVLQTLTLKEIEALIAPRKYPTPIMITGERISARTIRTEAVKIYVKRLPQCQTLPKDTHLQTLMRTGTKKKQDHRSTSFGGLVVKLLANKVTFNLRDFNRAKKRIESAFKPLTASTPVSGGVIESKV